MPNFEQFQKFFPGHIGDKLTLRCMQEKDKSRLVELLNQRSGDNYVTKYLYSHIPQPYKESDADFWINMGKKSFDTEECLKGLILAITQDDLLVGCIGYEVLSIVTAQAHVVELGYWLGLDYHGQGIMTAAVKWIVEFIRQNEASILRVQAKVFSPNIASVQVLKKCIEMVT
jgi:RimJ/RimL family protein N-acetyltransferase